jgi:hypothetical protein
VNINPGSDRWPPNTEPRYGPGTAPVPPAQPFTTPIDAYPTVPALRRRKPNRLPLILGIVGALLVLCCGGTALAAALAGGQASHQPAIVVVSNSPAPSSSRSPTFAPSPAVTTAAAPTTTAAAPKPPASAPTTRAPKPPATTAAGPPVQHGVHPGAFCSAAGALGYTNDGTLMRCTSTATDPRNGWRRA